MARFIENFTSTDIKQATVFNNELSTGNVMLWSNDATLKAYPEDEIITITSISQAKEYFATSTRTFKMLENLLTNIQGNVVKVNGKVFVCKTTATHATQSQFATHTINSNLSNLIAVANGSFNVVIKEGAAVLETQSYTGIDLTKFTTLQQIADYLNSIIAVSLKLEANKFVITNPIFGAGFSIELTAGGVGTNLIAGNLISISSSTSTAGINGSIANLISEFPIKANLLINNLATVPVLTNLDITNANIIAFAEALQNNFGTDVIYKNVFVASVSTLNPLINGLADTRNTDKLFKTFFVSTPAKDKETLHNLSSLTIAVLRSRNNFLPNNPKLTGQALELTTTNKILLVSGLLQEKNYQTVGKLLRDKGVALYKNLGSRKALSLGSYLDDNEIITIEKAFFKFDFENIVDNYNVNQVFTQQGASPSLTFEDGIRIAGLYSASFLSILTSNSIITPFEGDVLPFSITEGKSQTIKDNELKSMQSVGFFVLPEEISNEDKTASRIRMSFLLHTPSGLLKIESTGIAFN